MRSPWTVVGKVFSVTVCLDSVEAIRTLPRVEDDASGPAAREWSEIITTSGLYLPIDLPYPEVKASMDRAMRSYYGVKEAS